MHSLDSDYVRTPLPKDVPGYGALDAQGLLPRTPREPPGIRFRPTAHRALRELTLTLVVTVGALVAVMLSAGASGRFSPAGLAVFLVVAALGVAALAVMVRRWGRAVLGELEHGYITSTFTMGRFWAGRASPGGRFTLGWVQWDWSGVWVLAPGGQVRSAPTADADPPGWYPSPRSQEKVELWTGHQWTGYTKDR